MAARQTIKNQAGMSSTRTMDHVTAYLMILPSIGFLAVFVLVPLFMSVSRSFTNWRFYLGSEFIGFENYRMIFQNRLFLTSIKNVLWFVVAIVPTQIILSFLFAHALKGLAPRIGSFVKTAIYVPTVISGVVASVIFLFIFNYQGGVLNYVIRQLGGKRIAFLNEPTLSRIAVSITAIWMGFGYNSLIMLAGLMNIPQSYYEAAQVDGATPLAQLLHITIPSMRNVFILILIGQLTGTLQFFDLPYMMFGGGGGPVNATLTPMLFIYNNFKSSDYSMGYTIAGALMLMIVIGALNSIVFTLIGSEKAQDE
ncbi:sugar ABC transporter permease [Clostridia bacterium]|nr:sugar ABC transporter permease [Clostridia bacterium]